MISPPPIITGSNVVGNSGDERRMEGPSSPTDDEGRGRMTRGAAFDPTGHYANAYNRFAKDTQSQSQQPASRQSYRQPSRQAAQHQSFYEDDHSMSNGGGAGFTSNFHMPENEGMDDSFDTNFHTSRKHFSQTKSGRAQSSVPVFQAHNAEGVNYGDLEMEEEQAVRGAIPRFATPRLEVPTHSAPVNARGFARVPTPSPTFGSEYEPEDSMHSRSTRSAATGANAAPLHGYDPSQNPWGGAGAGGRARVIQQLSTGGSDYGAGEVDDDDDDEEDQIFINNGSGRRRPTKPMSQIQRKNGRNAPKPAAVGPPVFSASDYNNRNKNGKRSRATLDQPFRNIGEQLAESRYSGADMPWGINKTPEMTDSENVSDASLLKRGLSRTDGPRVCRRGYGANDPENIAIVNLKEHEGLTFAEIRERLNDKRIKEGKTPSLSVTGVANRYNRTAPVLFSSQGLEFVPLSQRKNKPGTHSRVEWTNEDDLALVQSFNEYDHARWPAVAKMFEDKTGKAITPEIAAQRHAIL
ncbi:hypothetical protein B0J14DRAFT_654218 [Halenospora varia]|nr:hypothetical protein B0J14DRAFT_654218 [Halenospora varia]